MGQVTAVPGAQVAQQAVQAFQAIQAAPAQVAASINNAAASCHSAVQSRIARVSAYAKAIFATMGEWATIVGSIVGTVVVIKIIATYPIVTIVGAIAAVVLYKNRQKIALIVSLWITMFKNCLGLKKHAWFHKIDDKLLLGGMPLEKKNHLENLQKENVKVAICLAQDKELKTESWFIHPMKKEAWESANPKIAFQHFPVDKGTSPQSIPQLDKAVDFMHEHIKQKSNETSDKAQESSARAYVYDAEGGGRAALFSVCYLVKYGKLSSKAAREKITAVRPAAVLTREQKGCVSEYLDYLIEKQSLTVSSAS